MHTCKSPIAFTTTDRLVGLSLQRRVQMGCCISSKNEDSKVMLHRGKVCTAAPSQSPCWKVLQRAKEKRWSESPPVPINFEFTDERVRFVQPVCQIDPVLDVKRQAAPLHILHIHVRMTRLLAAVRQNGAACDTHRHPR